MFIISPLFLFLQMTAEEFTSFKKDLIAAINSKQVPEFCKQFTASMSNTRGVSLDYKAEKGVISMTVRWPGMLVPGVAPFTPSKNDLPIVKAYIWGFRPYPDYAAAPPVPGVNSDAAMPPLVGIPMESLTTLSPV